MFLLLTLKKWDIDDITILFEYIKEVIELVCANSYKYGCYLILIGLMIDYKKQVLILDIKANM